MTDEIQKISNTQIEIRSEIPADTLEKEYQKLLKNKASGTTLKGFRKGEAPIELVEKNQDQSDILYQAAVSLLKLEYPRIVREEKLEVLGPPQISIIKLARKNPLIWKAVVYTLPDDIRLPDYAKVAREILKQKTLPEVSEKELEKNIGKLRSQLMQQKLARQQDEFRVKMLRAIAEKISVDLPQPMVEMEKEKMLGTLKQQVENSHMEWKAYLESIKQSEDDLRKNMENEARNRILFGMIIAAIAKKEGLTPTSEEIKKKAEQIKPYFGYEVDSEQIYNYALDMQTNENVFSFLEKLN